MAAVQSRHLPGPPREVRVFRIRGLQAEDSGVRDWGWAFGVGFEFRNSARGLGFGMFRVNALGLEVDFLAVASRVRERLFNMSKRSLLALQFLVRWRH